MTAIVAEPQADSPTWPFVLAFAKRMEAKLTQNRHKGGREGWQRLSYASLFDRIVEETGELAVDLEGYPTTAEHSEAVANECADIANFAMMLADKVTYDCKRA